MTDHVFNPWLDLGLLFGSFVLLLIVMVGIPAFIDWFIREYMD